MSARLNYFVPLSVLVVLSGCGQGTGKGAEATAGAGPDAASASDGGAADAGPESAPELELSTLAGAGKGECGVFGRDDLVTTAVVGKRLRAAAPRGSTDIPRAYSVMGAPEPLDHESRLIVETEKGGKFVVYARELFQTTPKEFAAKATGYFEEYHRTKAEELDIGLVATGDSSITVIGARPRKPAADGEAVLLLATLVRAADDTLLAVDYYVNPTGMADANACQEYALALASRLAAGSRVLDLKGGPRQLRWEGPEVVEVDLPPGYVTTTKPGPDFVVHFLRKLTPLGSYPGDVLIYVGGHPDTTVPSKPGERQVAEDGTVNGTKTRWEGWRSKTGGVLKATLPVKKGAHLQLQVIMRATLDGDYLAELRPIAESVRVR